MRRIRGGRTRLDSQSATGRQVAQGNRSTHNWRTPFFFWVLRPYSWDENLTLIFVPIRNFGSEYNPYSHSILPFIICMKYHSLTECLLSSFIIQDRKADNVFPERGSTILLLFQTPWTRSGHVLASGEGTCYPHTPYL